MSRTQSGSYFTMFNLYRYIICLQMPQMDWQVEQPSMRSLLDVNVYMKLKCLLLLPLLRRMCFHSFFVHLSFSRISQSYGGIFMKFCGVVRLGEEGKN